MVKQVLLTKRQAQAVKLYCKDGLNQAEIAEIMYGSIYRQSDVSRHLRLASKKLGINLTLEYSKARNPNALFNVEDLL